MSKPPLRRLISIWAKQPRVQLKVIGTIWTCWDVRKAGNLMKTGFLLKFLALPFLMLFGETPRSQFLPIFHCGVSGLQQMREASKEQWTWKRKIMIPILSNEGETISLMDKKASSKGVGKSTSHFPYWFNKPQAVHNIHRHLSTNNVPSVLSLLGLSMIQNFKNLFQIALLIYIYIFLSQLLLLPQL